jgi:hypothetical protein
MGHPAHLEFRGCGVALNRFWGHNEPMSNRSLYFLGAGIGGTVGGFLPGLWGVSDFSGQGILLSTIGGLVGIWAAHRFFVA